MRDMNKVQMLEQLIESNNKLIQMLEKEMNASEENCLYLVAINVNGKCEPLVLPDFKICCSNNREELLDSYGPHIDCLESMGEDVRIIKVDDNILSELKKGLAEYKKDLEQRCAQASEILEDYLPWDGNERIRDAIMMDMRTGGLAVDKDTGSIVRSEKTFWSEKANEWDDDYCSCDDECCECECEDEFDEDEWDYDEPTTEHIINIIL